MDAERIKEVIRYLLEATDTTPDPSTGYVDPCEEARAGVLREVLDEIARLEAME